MDCSGLHADGELRLLGGHIGGELDLSGARLHNASAVALYADGLQVDEDVFCRDDESGQRFEAEGELRLLGAKIGGQLNLRGARLSNTDGPALNADALRVEQNLLFGTGEAVHRFEAVGELLMLGAHIGGQLDLDGARLSNANGPVLSADGLRVDKDVFCRDDGSGQRFEADGELRLPGAHIGGQLNLNGAWLSNANGRALDANAVRDAQQMLCTESGNGQRFEADGELELVGAYIGGQLDLRGAQRSDIGGAASRPPTDGRAKHVL